MKNTILAIILLSLFSCSQHHPQIIIKTELGSITLELYQDKAPVTVANFLQYVDEHRLDSSNFYRIVNDDNQKDKPIKIQVIQGGLFEDHHPNILAPITHENTEQTGIKHTKGVISMARYEPGTATSEFFICIEDEPELNAGGMRNSDGAGFAAFGKVIKGMNVAQKIHQSHADGQYLNPRIMIYSIERLY